MSEPPVAMSYDQSPQLLDSFARVRSARLSFRPLRLSDQDALYQIMSDPDVSRYNRWETHLRPQDSRDYLQAVVDLYAQGQYLEWGIINPQNHLIGFFGLVWWLPDFASAEIGFSLGQTYWGQGYMQEALRALLDWGFSEMHINRFEAQCDQFNRSSQKVLERLNWSCEGLMRQKAYFKQRWHDVKLYSLLRSDPREECLSASQW